MKALVIGHSALGLFARTTPIGAHAAHTSASVTCTCGTAATVASVLVLLGDTVALHTPTEPGSGGAFIRGDLRGTGVELIDAHPRLATTPTITVSVDTDGSALVTSGAPSHLFLEDAPEARIDRIIGQVCPDVVVVDAHTPHLAVPAARLCRDRRIPVIAVIDALRPRTDELLPYTDLAVSTLFPGSAETAGEQVTALLDGGAHTAVVYCHGESVHYRSRDGELGVFAAPVILHPVDPVFADQVFAGALIHALGRAPTSGGLARGITQAVACAQASCFHIGPRAGVERVTQRRSAPARGGRGPHPLLRAV